MHPRQKKLILMLGFGPALLAYALLMVWVSQFVPRHWLAQLVYYVLAGTVWAFPLKPVLGWANSPPKIRH